MSKLMVKKFATPDETRPFTHGRMDVIQFEGGIVGRGVFESGWRWSKDVAPIAGTKSCQVSHAVYVLSGRMHLKMDDGTEEEIGPGDFAVIPPGHDAWTLGNDACVAFDFAGAAHYAKQAAGARAEPTRTH
ncbi:MAG TPA: cupin domain-containing protein [Anaeromyxobacteraceae bacterium]|nr:cupin domain-containing protein [Anaeromyxobacteraceae bacterium]